MVNRRKGTIAIDCMTLLVNRGEGDIGIVIGTDGVVEINDYARLTIDELQKIRRVAKKYRDFCIDLRLPRDELGV